MKQIRVLLDMIGAIAVPDVIAITTEQTRNKR